MSQAKAVGGMRCAARGVDEGRGGCARGVGGGRGWEWRWGAWGLWECAAMPK